MKIFAIIKKELQTYFFSPVAYIVFASFLLVIGYLFSVVLVTTKIATIEPLLFNAGFILLLVSPVLTMRLLSEERKSNTIELLLTSPISPAEIVMGKFLSCYIVYLVLMLLTLQYPAILNSYSSNLDFGPIESGYLGFALLGASFISIGIFASALAENQIISAMVSFGILILFWIIGWIKFALDNPVGELISKLSLFERYSDFLKGVVDSSNVIYFVIFTMIWLFLATRVLESDRWR